VSIKVEKLYVLKKPEYRKLMKLAMEANLLKAELKDKDAAFDLRWQADMRAIKKWQKATGKKLVWPDHADLCVWLLEQLDKKK
jgi:hypothetical protein